MTILAYTIMQQCGIIAWTIIRPVTTYRYLSHYGNVSQFGRDVPGWDMDVKTDLPEDVALHTLLHRI